MRQIAGQITTAEQARVLFPTHTLLLRDDIPRWAAPSFQSGGSIDTGVPQTFARPSSSGILYVTFRALSGGTYVKVINPDVASDWALTTSGATGIATAGAVGCLRPAVFTRSDTTQTFLFNVIQSGGTQFQVRSLNISSQTSNPISLTGMADYGPPIPVQPLDTATKVVRVEAVCPTLTGAVVAIGTHNFTLKTSTLTFWYVTATAVRQMRHVIQMPLTEIYTGWEGFAKHCTYVAAASGPTPSVDHIRVFAPMAGLHPKTNGYTVRTMTWTRRFNVDSAMEPLIPVDIEQVNALFQVASVAKINGSYYATGRMDRYSSDGSLTGFDCFASSVDFDNWSIEERAGYLSSTRMMGTLIQSYAQSTLFYGGMGWIQTAVSTVQQYSGVAAPYIWDASSRLGEFTQTEVVNGADTLDVKLHNMGDDILGQVALRNGATMVLNSGQGGVLGLIGIYSIDSIDGSNATKGSQEVGVRGRDVTGKKLADYKFPVDLWLPGLSNVQIDMGTLDKLQLKTNEPGSESDATANGGKYFGWKKSPTSILYNDVNSPAMWLLDAAQQDGEIQLIARTDGGSGPHLSMVGILLNVNEATDKNITGHLLLIPKTNTWTGHTQATCQMRTLALPAIDQADQEKDNTGWKLTSRRNVLWAKEGDADLRTTAAPGTVTVANAYTIPTAADQVIVVRLSGRAVQVYAKALDLTPDGAANNAAFSLIYEYLYTEDEIIRKPGKVQCGLALCTDVYSDTTAFQQAEYGDVEVGLSHATFNLATNGVGSFQYVIGTATYDNSGRFTAVNITVAGYQLKKTQLLRITGSGNEKMIQITAKDSDALNSSFNGTVIYSANAGGVGTVNLQVVNEAEYWAWASSGMSQKTDNDGKPIPIDPGGRKKQTRIGGRGIFISETNSAAMLRWIETDGVVHWLMSGDVGGAGETPSTATGSRVGWALTANPIPEGGLYWTGSDPGAWRMLLHHGRFFKSSATAYGLPDGVSSKQYMIVDNEIIRYRDESFAKLGERASVTWCSVPAYYTALAAMAENSAVLTHWHSGINYPGDLFNAIPDVAGLLVEITARATEGKSESKNIYAVSAQAGPPDTLTIDTVYPNPLLDLEAVAILSGRGQWGTRKEQHEKTAPVCFYPGDIYGLMPNISIKRFDAFMGRFNNTEDTLRFISCAAGAHNINFRAAWNDPALTLSPRSISLGTSFTALPLRENLASFTLDLNAHLPGNGIGTGNYTNWLAIRFRGYYELRIGQFNTQTDLTGGFQGNVRLELLNTYGDVNPDGNGKRLLESIRVRVDPNSISGPYSGAGGNWSLTENTSEQSVIRVAVHDATIVVELNGQHLHTFNLSRLVNYQGNYYRNWSGPIELAYGATLSGNTVTAWVGELGDPVSGRALRGESSARSAIDDFTGNRHVKSRTTANGGIEFSQWWLRDDAGTMRYNLTKDAWSKDDGKTPAHIRLTGANDVAAEYIDDATARAEGVQYQVESNDTVETVDQAMREARLLIRRFQEETEGRSVEGHGYLALQVEDKVTLQYAGAGGLTPVHTATPHIITGISRTASKTALRSNVNVRKYVP